MLETLDYTIRIGSTQTFLYFDLYLYSAYAANYVYIYIFFFSVSKPAIAGLVVFLVLLVSALLMFFFYRRRKSSKNKTLRSPPQQVVRQDVITVPTETVHLASQGSPRPIPAAPDYGSVGIARRLSRKDVLEGSSSSEEEARESDNNGVLQKYDWSSPRRTKSEDRAKAAGPMKGDENANGRNLLWLYVKLKPSFVDY